MELPDVLISQVREGKAVIFLGAGASKESRDSKGRRPPDGDQLGKLIADKFLGGKHRNSPLTMIADYAISESDQGKVQAFIKDIFDPFEPSEAHRMLGRFRWHGIATTNYERLIEKVYEGNSSALQCPQPLIEDTDRVEDNQRDPRHVRGAGWVRDEWARLRYDPVADQRLRMETTGGRKNLQRSIYNFRHAN